MNKVRCSWAKGELDIAYHDTEWGRKTHDERELFEYLILEGMQAGLSWSLILKKRENFKRAFDNFDYNICANYSDEYLESLRSDEGIIRNKLKIYGVRKNAIAFIKIQEEFGSFDKYIWNFTNYKTINSNHKTSSYFILYLPKINHKVPYPLHLHNHHSLDYDSFPLSLN